MKLSSNVVGESNVENNQHKLLLTQVSKLLKAFKNNSSANILLSKTRLHNIGESGGFLGWILGPLIKTRLSLMKNVLKLLTKSVLIPLGLTAAESATDATIHKKIFGSGRPLGLTSCMQH